MCNALEHCNSTNAALLLAASYRGYYKHFAELGCPVENNGGVAISHKEFDFEFSNNATLILTLNEFATPFVFQVVHGLPDIVYMCYQVVYGLPYVVYCATHLPFLFTSTWTGHGNCKSRKLKLVLLCSSDGRI